MRDSDSSKWIADPSAAEDQRIKSGLAFPDGRNLLALLDGLIARPARFGSARRLPLIHLTRPSEDVPDPLDGIENRIGKAAGRGIPYGRISGDAALSDDSADDTDRLVTQLDAVTRAMSGEFRRVRGLTFPRYGLARWLWRQVESEQPAVDPDRVWKSVDQLIRDYVRGRYPAADRGQLRVEAVQSFPWPVQVVAWLPLVALLLMRTAWRPLRWVAAYRMDGQDSFSRLVYRLTVLHRADVDRQRADRFRELLTDAVLEDLRNAYRRTTILGTGRRRTTYPVLLVDDVHENTAGLLLMRLLDAAQGRARRRPAPLLVVSTGRADATEVTGGTEVAAVYSAANAGSAYATWRAAVDGSGTFVLPMSLPDKNSRRDYDKLLYAGVPHGRRPVTSLLAAGLLAALLVPVYQGWQSCGTFPWQSDLKRVDGPGRHQCVGLAPPGYRFFDQAPGADDALLGELRHVEQTIHDTNTEARRRPGYVTVVFVGSLSPSSTESYRTEMEELRGLATFQKSSLDTRPMEVRLANAGVAMAHAEFTAEAIIKEARNDRRLLAVVGLGTSTQGARDAMKLLADPDGDSSWGIPMVATMLTSTRVAEGISYYHQVGPDNRRQAELVAGYVDSVLGLDRAHVYYFGDPGDLYSSDLKDHAQREFEARGVAVVTQAYRTSRDQDGVQIEQLGSQACQVGESEVIFYAGRALHFKPFLDSLTTTCRELRRIIAGDDVTGFVLDGKLKPYSSLTLEYVSLASNLAWGPTCDDAPGASAFFSEYDRLFGEGSSCLHTRDSHAILSYDALLTVKRGIDNTDAGTDQTPNRDQLLNGIEEIRQGASTTLAGASGIITFRPNESTPTDKAILLLSATGSDAPDVVMLCGTLAESHPDPGNHRCPL